tara:strand:+ start:958 stop:1488 length:531 start_codon:yes stop_codon:yes gene_type:complete
MPAVSKAQQRFFGMVRATQKGEMKNPSSEILDVADDISIKDAKKMAKTKHKGLPEKVKTEGVTYGYKGKKYKKLPAHVKTPAGWGNDDRSELGKAKDAITDKLGITNTKKHGVLAKEDADYKSFMKNVQDARDKVKKKTDDRKKKDASYVDRVKKGIRFYDKKGKGHIRSGKKVYD